jgi:hypothetical protein
MPDFVIRYKGVEMDTKTPLTVVKVHKASGDISSIQVVGDRQVPDVARSERNTHKYVAVPTEFFGLVNQNPRKSYSLNVQADGDIIIIVNARNDVEGA